MLNAVIVLMSILGGGFLGILLGVALAMYRYEHDDNDTTIMNCYGCDIYDTDKESEDK